MPETPTADTDGDDSGRTTLREQQGELTRAGLVQLALEALESGGEQAVKIREIGNALGVSVGAVYHHFDSREELIVAARIAQFEGALTGDVEAIRDLVERVDTVDQLRREMRYLNRAAHSTARSSYRRLRAEVAGVARHNDDLARELSRVQDRCTAKLAEAVVLAQAKGLGRAGLDPVATATFLQAIALGLVLDDINLDHPMDRERWHELTDHVYESLLAES